MQREQRPTVVLLHSSASSGRQWEALVQTLTPRFRVHAIDFHGHGKLSVCHGDTPADDAALVAPLLADGAHIVGHSYGGAVALKVATMYPTLVRSLVAYEPVLFHWLINERHGPVQDVIAVADAMRERLASHEDHSAAQVFVDFWSGAGSWESLPEGKRTSIAARMCTVLQHFDALFSEPLQRAQLSLLRIPMLFMTGTHTVAVTRRVAELLRITFPDAQHEAMSGMSHMGPITHAADVNRRLVEFLHAQALSDSDLEPLSAAA